jgi:hypothetical protein
MWAALAACSAPSEPAPPPPAPIAAPPAPAAPVGCAADGTHCCMPDGRVVQPGGCQPSYPDDVEPATERAADGTCNHIPCFLKCLPADARIATPRGEIAVSRLMVGDPVWSADEKGKRIEARVARVASVPVSGHAIVELRLMDGRVLRASARHPLAGGRWIAGLSVGERLDGSIIASMRKLPYQGTHTWDLLPDGPTGWYWADGVLLGSTLR